MIPLLCLAVRVTGGDLDDAPGSLSGRTRPSHKSYSSLDHFDVDDDGFTAMITTQRSALAKMPLSAIATMLRRRRLIVRTLLALAETETPKRASNKRRWLRFGVAILLGAGN